MVSIRESERAVVVDSWINLAHSRLEQPWNLHPAHPVSELREYRVQFELIVLSIRIA